jgi:hypothetical protein
LAVPPVLATDIPPWAEEIRRQAEWSWNHHDTLKYLAAGGGLLLFAWLAHAREWPAVLKIGAAIGGVAAIVGAGFVGLLGDWARETGNVSGVVVARETRASHGGGASMVVPGGLCHTGWDCAGGNPCVKAPGDSDTRCWAKCPGTGICPAGQQCEKLSGSLKICTYPSDREAGRARK